MLIFNILGLFHNFSSAKVKKIIVNKQLYSINFLA